MLRRMIQRKNTPAYDDLKIIISFYIKVVYTDKHEEYYA